jgi:hypothetical protein
VTVAVSVSIETMTIVEAEADTVAVCVSVGSLKLPEARVIVTTLGLLAEMEPKGGSGWNGTCAGGEEGWGWG